METDQKLKAWTKPEIAKIGDFSHVTGNPVVNGQGGHIMKS